MFVCCLTLTAPTSQIVLLTRQASYFEENIPPPTPLDYEVNKSRNLDPKSYSYSTSLHTFAVTSSWVFSYLKVYKLWIPTNHMGLKGLTSQQQASVSQGRICSVNFTCCRTEIEVADQTFYLTQSQYTDTGPTSPSADPITPGAWQGSHWSANFEVTGMTRPRKNPGASGIRTRDLPLSRRTPYH